MENLLFYEELDQDTPLEEVLEFYDPAQNEDIPLDPKRHNRPRVDEEGNWMVREAVESCGTYVIRTNPLTGAPEGYHQFCRLNDACPGCRARAAEEVRMQAENAFYRAGKREEPLYMLELDADDPINAVIFEHVPSKDRKSFPFWPDLKVQKGKILHLLLYPMHETRAKNRYPIEGAEAWPLVKIENVETIQKMDFVPYAVTMPGKKVSGKLGGTKAATVKELEKNPYQVCSVEMPGLEVEEAELIHKKVASLTNHMEPTTIAEAVALANERSMAYIELCKHYGFTYREKWNMRYFATDENLTIDWRWYNIKCKFFVEADEEKLVKIAARFKK